MALTIITFADLGKKKNLKTNDILPVINFFDQKKELSSVINRVGIDKEKSYFQKSTIPLVFHYFLAGLNFLIKKFPYRTIEENIFDFVASRMNFKKGEIVIFHPPKFKRTIKKAKKAGAICVGLATYSSTPYVTKLFNQELNRLKINKKINAEIEFTKETDYLIALSDFSRNTYIEDGYPKDRIYTANLDVDYNKFSPREKYKECFTVVFPTSSTSILKGLQYVLDAWSDVDIPNKKLIITGQMDNWPKEIEKKYKLLIEKDSTIDFVGFCKNMPEVLSRAHVTILPSFTEGFSRAVLESMASGTPVILTKNTTDTSSFFKDSIHGIVVPVGDSFSIKKALEYCFNNEEKMKEMSKFCREAVISKKPFAESIYEIYQDVKKRESK